MGSDRVYADGSAVRREPWTGLWYAVLPSGAAVSGEDRERGVPLKQLYASYSRAVEALGAAGFGPLAPAAAGVA